MSFRPDDAALLSEVEFTALLSERDLALRVPIDFVGLPGLSLTKSCFADGIYHDDPAVKCFSNLIAASISAYEIDVYWDTTARTWSLCPFQLGPVPSFNGSSTGSATSASSRSTALPKRGDEATKRQPDRRFWQRQQISDTASSTFSGTSTTGMILPGSTSPAPKPVATEPGMIRAGSYSCSNKIDLGLFLQVLDDFLGGTENTYNASLQYLYLNVHAAAPRSNPAGPAVLVSPEDLPNSTMSLSSVLYQNISPYVYGPSDLDAQRANINSSTSWYSHPLSWQPDTRYFTVNGNGSTTSTTNGWPGEGFIELRQGKRIVAAFSQVEPQMSNYHSPADDNMIFPLGYLASERNVTISTTGALTSGCLFNPNSYSVSASNSSWAYTTLTPTTSNPDLLTEARNLTSCGISPFLNQTLSNTTADKDITPYLQYSMTASWAWSLSQPANSSDPNFRCAAMNSTTGRWQVATCTSHFYAACRPDDAPSPYMFNISEANGAYSKVDLGCAGSTHFSVPRTALENSHLVATWRDWKADRVRQGEDDGGDLLWVNMNSLDSPFCWVAGQTSTCPYLDEGTPVNREVVVPTVAAVIVFVVAALMVFVKCAANRRNTRRRKRRGEGGWDYEGVPS